jgi:NADPH-dependent curcumin reductase CurA
VASPQSHKSEQLLVCAAAGARVHLRAQVHMVVINNQVGPLGGIEKKAYVGDNVRCAYAI